MPRSSRPVTSPWPRSTSTSPGCAPASTTPHGDPRLGAERFGRKLALTLDTASDADRVLARAEADLERVEALIESTAARLDRGPATGRVRRVLDRLAAEGRVDNDSVVGLCTEALDRATAFVREHDLVTVPDDPVEIIVMPEIHRGVAVAYCDPPGPLEPSPLPTYFAVSPTPADWTDAGWRPSSASTTPT